MATHENRPYLKKGVTSDTETDLIRFFKKWLNFFGITTYDKCCDTESDFRPVRYNTADSVVEYFNGTEWVPIA